MNKEMTLILTVAVIIIGVAILIIAHKEAMKNVKCKKTAYSELPLKPVKWVYVSNKEMAKKMKQMGIDDHIAKIILAIRMIEQPRRAPNFNFWGIHTDIGRWPYHPDFRVCVKEAFTLKAREYAGFNSLESALRWMEKVITLKYNNYIKKHKSFDFADFYAKKWKGGKRRESDNKVFARAGRIMEGVV